MSQAMIMQMQKAPEPVVDSIWNWMDGTKPVVERESHFLDDRDDLLCLSTEHSKKEYLENIMERHLYNLFVTKVSGYAYLQTITNC